jgi:prevent-host-death family protein
VDRVTVRDLRNNGGEVVRRVEHGERIVVTRDGAPVTELRPLPRASASPTELIRRRRNLPRVNPADFRRDVDAPIDPVVARADLQFGEDLAEVPFHGACAK